MNEYDKLLRELATFRKEHHELDITLSTVGKDKNSDVFSINRLKKRKLWLKDKIAELETMIYPDIIA